MSIQGVTGGSQVAVCLQVPGITLRLVKVRVCQSFFVYVENSLMHSAALGSGDTRHSVFSDHVFFNL